MTIFYFEFTGSAPVQRAHLHAGWQYVSEWKPGRMRMNKGPIGFENQHGAGTVIGPWTAGNLALDRQYWSPPLSGNQVVNGEVLSMNIQVREVNANDNVDRVYTALYLCNATGGVKDVLLDLRDYCPKSEFNTAFRNKICFSSNTSSIGKGPVIVTSNYDYFVLEVGYRDSGGTSPEAQARWGINTEYPDTAGNELETDPRNGRFALSQDFVFLEEAREIDED